MAEGEAREGPPAGTVLGARPLRDEASEEEALRGMVADLIVEAFAWVGPALGQEAKARLRGGDAGRPTSLWWSTIAAPSRRGCETPAVCTTGSATRPALPVCATRMRSGCSGWLRVRAM